MGIEPIRKPVPPAPPVAARPPAIDAADDLPAASAGAPSDEKAGALVHTIAIDRDRRRALLLSDQVTPIFASCKSDLLVGDYVARYDRQSRLLVFDAGQVKPGLRFELTFEKKDRLESIADLTWADPTFIFVRPDQGSAALIEDAADLIVRTVQGGDPDFALYLLNGLDDPTMYDVLRRLDADNQSVLFELDASFALSWRRSLQQEKSVDGLRLLRALDTFVWTRRQLYVDAFDWIGIHPDTWKPPKPGETGSTVQIVFAYGLNLPGRQGAPSRAIVRKADDILDLGHARGDALTYGDWGLLYPSVLSKATTPRMWQAKQQVLSSITAMNNVFIETSYTAVQSVLGLVSLGQTLLSKTIPAATGVFPRAPTGLKRPISDRQPGQWAVPLNAGRSRNEEDMVYEAFACQKDREPMRNFFLTDPATGRPVALDGFNGQKLLDAKNWRENGFAMRVMEGRIPLNSPRAASFVDNLRDEAQRQLRAANGIPIEYRVRDARAAELLRGAFRTWDLPIEVVHYPMPGRTGR